jgi:phosphatidylserine/phosphatidylglycerophosphate/cardiolipin synthase-like enzyme
MKKSLLLFLVLLVGCSSGNVEQQQDRALGGKIDVFFSPNGGCTAAVVRELSMAKTRVLVQAYSFTSKPIADALIEAHQRGVKVSVILDDSQINALGSKASALIQAGIEVKFDKAHAIAHNKVMIIDEGTILTGSFNFTAAAEKSNSENLLVIKNRVLAQEYVANWHKHYEHSVAP